VDVKVEVAGGTVFVNVGVPVLVNVDVFVLV
jgi:hypothetical protein